MSGFFRWVVLYLYIQYVSLSCNNPLILIYFKEIPVWSLGRQRTRDHGVAYSIGGQELYPAQSPCQRRLHSCFPNVMGLKVDLRSDSRLSIHIHVFIYHIYICIHYKHILPKKKGETTLESYHPTCFPSSLQKLHALLRNVWVS